MNDMAQNEYEYVAVGSVRHGEWMRRFQAEAEEIPYREITEAEAEEINEQIAAS